jgi:8-oxo-dGTP diphosphatase
MSQIISSVKALLQHNDKFLLLKETMHHGDIWDLPGGKIEYGEEPTQALVREVREEVDISIQVLKSIGIWWFYSQNSKHQVICHTFLCKPASTFIIDMSKNPADEHFSEFRWATIPEILDDPEIIVTDSLRSLLVEFNKEFMVVTR